MSAMPSGESRPATSPRMLSVPLAGSMEKIPITPSVSLATYSARELGVSTAMDRSNVSDVPPVSEAVIVTSELACTTVGVPEMTPVEPSMLMPKGSAPVVIAKVSAVPVKVGVRLAMAKPSVRLAVGEP